MRHALAHVSLAAMASGIAAADHLHAGGPAD